MSLLLEMILWSGNRWTATFIIATGEARDIILGN